MTRPRLAAAPLAALLVLAGCGATKHPAASVAYSVTLPPGWKTGPPPPKPSVGTQVTRVFTGPSTAGNRAIMAISVRLLPTVPTPAEVARGARGAAATHHNLASALSPTTLGGSPAYTYEAFDRDKAGLPVWGQEVIAVHNSAKYDVVAFAPRSNYAPARTDFRRILASWRWLAG